MFANFSCIQTKYKSLNISSKTNQSYHKLNGLSHVLCNNSEWIGLTGDNTTECVKTYNISTPLDVMDIENEGKFSIHLIIILLTVLLICFLLIITLIVYTMKTRKRVRKLSAIEVQSGVEDMDNDLNDEYDDNIVSEEYEEYSEYKEVKNDYKMITKYRNNINII